MAKPLPPFSGDTTTCPKCSNTDAFTEYKPEGEPRSGFGAWGTDLPERLERRCARCGFIWEEQTNPPVEETEPDAAESPYFANLPDQP
ncbi:MAG: hypothetical protein HOV68_27615 [Streptomycetaceae bacterium]|nr:hypothetical protein [Streptomycetaceae bacterium]